MKHGLSRTRIYNIYKKMMYRCYKKNNNRYYCYGAKNIKVCEEWKSDFLSFYNWAMENGYRNGLTIDRLNNKKDYSPENCKWSNLFEQANNKTNNHTITFNGSTLSMAEWARKYHLDYDLFRSRIRKGWSFEKALKTPKRKYAKA